MSKAARKVVELADALGSFLDRVREPAPTKESTMNETPIVTEAEALIRAQRYHAGTVRNRGDAEARLEAAKTAHAEKVTLKGEKRAAIDDAQATYEREKSKDAALAKVVALSDSELADKEENEAAEAVNAALASLADAERICNEADHELWMATALDAGSIARLDAIAEPACAKIFEGLRLLREGVTSLDEAISASNAGLASARALGATVEHVDGMRTLLPLLEAFEAEGVVFPREKLTRLQAINERVFLSSTTEKFVAKARAKAGEIVDVFLNAEPATGDAADHSRFIIRQLREARTFWSAIVDAEARQQREDLREWQRHEAAKRGRKHMTAAEFRALNPQGPSAVVANETKSDPLDSPHVRWIPSN